MLGGADQEEVFALDLVHHRVHLCEGHNAGYDVGADHVGRYAVGEALVDHEIARVRNDCGVQACDIAHQIIEAVACDLACGVEVDTAELLHDLGVVGYLKIGDDRLAEALDLYVLAVVLTDRDAGVDDVRDDHHDLGDLLVELGFFLLELLELSALSGYLSLELLCLLALAAGKAAADLLGDLVAVGSQRIRLALSGSRLLIELDDLVN